MSLSTSCALWEWNLQWGILLISHSEIPDQLEQARLVLSSTSPNTLTLFATIQINHVLKKNHVMLLLCPCSVLLHRSPSMQSTLFPWPISFTTSSFKKPSQRILPGHRTHSSFIYHSKCYLLYEAFSNFFRWLQILFPWAPTPYLKSYPSLSHCMAYLVAQLVKIHL